jgi:RHS repeat-associated protein
VSSVVTVDANGNIGQLLDASDGSLKAHYEYGPYGGLTAQSGTESTNNIYRFSSKYLDTETGLLYYGYRYYGAETGRWLSRDPIGERGGLNVYGFVQNDPIGRVDPLGLDDFDEVTDILTPVELQEFSQTAFFGGQETYTEVQYDDMFVRHTEKLPGDGESCCEPTAVVEVKRTDEGVTYYPSASEALSQFLGGQLWGDYPNATVRMSFEFTKQEGNYKHLRYWWRSCGVTL